MVLGVHRIPSGVPPGSFRGYADQSSRHAGKRLATQPLIHGRNPDTWFDKDVRSLANGDVYMDPIMVEKKIQEMIGGKPVSERAFFPPKNAKKRCVESRPFRT